MELVCTCSTNFGARYIQNHARVWKKMAQTTACCIFTLKLTACGCLKLLFQQVQVKTENPNFQLNN
eukprot:scaffold368257_cov28-Attheya_sp.AAC.1